MSVGQRDALYTAEVRWDVEDQNRKANFRLRLRRQPAVCGTAKKAALGDALAAGDGERRRTELNAAAEGAIAPRRVLEAAGFLPVADPGKIGSPKNINDQQAEPRIARRGERVLQGGIEQLSRIIFEVAPARGAQVNGLAVSGPRIEWPDEFGVGLQTHKFAVRGGRHFGVHCRRIHDSGVRFEKWRAVSGVFRPGNRAVESVEIRGALFAVDHGIFGIDCNSAPEADSRVWQRAAVSQARRGGCRHFFRGPLQHGCFAMGAVPSLYFFLRWRSEVVEAQTVAGVSGEESCLGRRPVGTAVERQLVAIRLDGFPGWAKKRVEARLLVGYQFANVTA